MQIHLKAIGCRLNEAELEGWAREFKADGHQVVNDANEADLMVFNSCAVTQQAVRKSRQYIKRIQRDNPTAKIIMSGCYASLNSEEAAGALGVDLVVENKQKDQLVKIATQELNLPVMPQAATEPGESSLFQRGRQRAFIKIQDGCRYRCTFCIVTVARGDERSRTLEEIVAEINDFHQQGIQEIALTGVHVGGYGSDLDSTLYQLLETILRETDMPRIRLASVEPWDLPEHFFELFKNPRLMPHMHLPLQSGTNSVLRRMARRCKTADFKALVEQARATVPNFNITSDIIVGFPGETEQEWQESLAFIQEVGFGHLHIFSYSPRSGTKAATLANPIPEKVKKERSKILHQLAQEMKLKTLAGYVGHQVEVLWEGEGKIQADGKKRYWGYAPNYLRVAIDVDPEQKMSNQITAVTLKSVDLEGECLLAH
ncbi:MAG: tRNA (N(6)-L-threonylcarbamoyladenosine(37)-C(2))-methylthiotransferase MtaB [Gammaproteobacteria bacterium]|nr:tRNA (N(6)-L-threonylcarbamoyladenosine(37)-C(2))-methylthiotransferase MtaB [Gammaproteobacteria bacterium]